MTKSEKLKSIFNSDPEILALLQQKEHVDLMKEIILRPAKDLAREMMRGEKGEKGDKGDPGEDGYTPVKNVDYFDGIDGLDGRDGKDGKDGKDAPILDEEKLISKVISRIPEDDDSEIMKMISDLDDRLKKITNLSLEDIIKEIKTKKLIDRRDIRGMRLDDQKWHGGGTTYKAGTNITFTNNADGTVTITAQGGTAGSTITSEVLAGTQSGDNVNLVFSGLSQTATSIVNIARNGKVMTPGSTNVDGYVLTGVVSAVVYGADAGDTFLVTYGY